MRVFRSAGLLWAGAAVVTACGGGGTGPSGNPGFTALIGGQTWTALASTIQVTTGGGVPGTVVITGTMLNGQDYTSLILHLGYVSGQGDYPLGVNAGSNAGGSGTVTEYQGGAFRSWFTAFPGNAGKVTITSLTNNRIEGRFDFTAPPMIGSPATGTKMVTGGSFNLALTTPISAVPANDYGNKVTGLVGGALWNGATIVALGSFGTTNILGIAANSDDYSISIQSQVPITAGNSYPFTNQGFIVTAQRTGTAQSWVGLNGSGTVTVSSIGNGRMTGRVDGTLGAGAGGGGSLSLANLQFDVKVLAP
jgi:hypothetical protein